MELMLTMSATRRGLSSAARNKCGRAAWVTDSIPWMLTPIIRFQSSRSAPTTGPSSIRPALLTRVSSRPKCSTVCLTAVSACAGSVMSASTTSAVPPASWMSRASASRRYRRRARRATAAPCSASRRAVASPIPLLVPVISATVPVRVVVIESDVVMIEVAGQLAVRVGQFEEQLGPVLEGGDRVGASGEAQRRLVLGGQVDQRVGELGGIAPLSAVHALPGGDGLLGPLGVVGDRGFGVLRRLRRQQLGAEEPGLDQHRADPERRNLRGQRLHPALHPELRGSVRGQELSAPNAGGRAHRE